MSTHRGRTPHPEPDRDTFQAAQLRLLADLLPSVVHDLRGHLNTLVLNLELLRAAGHDAGGGVDGADGRRERYLDALEREVRRLDRCLGPGLSTACSTGEEPGRFDLGPLLDEVRELLASRAGKRRVEIAVTRPGRPLLLSGVRDRLKAALLQLTDSRLAGLGPGGTLPLSAELGERHVHIRIGAEEAVPAADAETALRLCLAEATARRFGGRLSVPAAGPVLLTLPAAGEPAAGEE